MSRVVESGQSNRKLVSGFGEFIFKKFRTYLW